MRSSVLLQKPSRKFRRQRNYNWDRLQFNADEPRMLEIEVIMLKIELMMLEIELHVKGF